MDTVDLHLALTLAKMDLSLGKLQALKVLTMLQCLAEIGPQKLAQGMISLVNYETVDGAGHFFLIPSSPGLCCFDTVKKHLVGDGCVSC